MSKKLVLNLFDYLYMSFEYFCMTVFLLVLVIQYLYANYYYFYIFDSDFLYHEVFGKPDFECNLLLWICIYGFFGTFGGLRLIRIKIPNLVHALYAALAILLILGTKFEIGI